MVEPLVHATGHYRVLEIDKRGDRPLVSCFGLLVNLLETVVSIGKRVALEADRFLHLAFIYDLEAVESLIGPVVKGIIIILLVKYDLLVIVSYFIRVFCLIPNFTHPIPDSSFHQFQRCTRLSDQ